MEAVSGGGAAAGGAASWAGAVMDWGEVVALVPWVLLVGAVAARMLRPSSVYRGIERRGR